MTPTATTLILVALTILCTSVSQLLQKQAAIQLTISDWRSSLSNTALLKSIVLLVTGLLLWVLVLNRLDVSKAYPLLSINFILVPLLAHWRLGEHIPFHRICGSIAIIIGIIFLLTG